MQKKHIVVLVTAGSYILQLAKQIPNTQRGSISEAPASIHSEAVENGYGLCSGNRNTQGNALQHWTTHMAHRRRQQSFLSGELISEHNSQPVRV